MGETAYLLPDNALEKCAKCYQKAIRAVVKYGRTYSHTYFYCEKHLPKRFQKSLEGGENNS